jgi:hypothetical protein
LTNLSYVIGQGMAFIPRQRVAKMLYWQSLGRRLDTRIGP